MQQAAIEEHRQNARENPIAADAVRAAVAGGSTAQTQNVENLLDFDADGGMPASIQKQPPPGGTGLEGLAGTPQRVASPAPVNGRNGVSHELSDIFGNGDSEQQQLPGDDMMNGFASLDLNIQGKQPAPPRQQLSQRNEDLLGDLI